MLVTHENTNITHVAMGGLDAIECGITGDAHFMHMLSASLYKDQMLAMVRETICNAWDAHIMVGNDRPIEISLTAEELIIRDYGPGINHEQIGPIYGVYGASTKKLDGRQTGGFGLGCKSPWSYTDTFEVTSCHNGKKAIYQMTKSSAERQGKPSIKPIVINLPTEESGITVRIRIDSNDYLKIREDIKKVVYYGGIPCILNDNKPDTLDYSKAVNGWLYASKYSIGDADLMVRYGNVVYPITDYDALNDSIYKVRNHLNSLPYTSPRACLILEAEPDSLAPMPNREELTMIDLTVNTLNNLMDSFIKQCVDHSPQVNKQALDRISKCLESNPNRAVYWDKSVPADPDQQLVKSNNSFCCTLNGPLVSARELYDFWLNENYPNGPEFIKADIKLRYEVLKKNHCLNWNKKLTRSFERVLSRQSRFEESQWIKKNLFHYLLRKAATKDVAITPKNLGVIGKTEYWRPIYVLSNEYVNCKDFTTSHFLSMSVFLINTVVVTHNRKTIKDRLYDHPDLQDCGRGLGCLVVSVPRSVDGTQKVLNFLKTLDIRVLDMTTIHDWEDEVFHLKPKVVNATPVPKKPRTPKKTGFISLSAAIQDGYYDTIKHARDNPDAARIEKPEFFVQLKRKDSYSSEQELGGFTYDESKTIVHLFGDKGAICRTKIEIQKAQQLGAIHISEWVLDRVLKEMKTNKRILKHLRDDADTLLSSYSSKDILTIKYLKTDKELCDHYGILSSRLERDRDQALLTLFNSIKPYAQRTYSRLTYPTNGSATTHFEYQKLVQKLDSLLPSTNLSQLAKKINEGLLVHLIDCNSVRNFLKDAALPDDAKQEIRSFLINAIG